MERKEFEALIKKVITELPPEFRERLENIDMAVEDWPTREQLRSAGMGDKDTLLGLYQGIPHTRRTIGYNMVLPDTITIFQKTIERKCRHQEKEIVNEVRRVVCHEVAHHFGFDDRQLKKIGI